MARAPRPTLSAAVLLRQGLDAGPVETRRLTVLVAEAEPVRRQRLVATLEATGARSIGVGSWSDAQGALGRVAVDAAILALDLPQAGRLEAGRVLRTWTAPISGLPLLALQDGMMRVQEKDWRDAGFDALLRWPEDLTALPERVRDAVVRLSPPPPLDPAIRAALLEELGTEELARRDLAALHAAGAGMAALRAAGDAAAALEAAGAIAAACEAIGALTAAAAAREAGRDVAQGEKRLAQALAAAGAALRFAGRAGR